jgi:hypothetical protein
MKAPFRKFLLLNACVASFQLISASAFAGDDYEVRLFLPENSRSVMTRPQKSAEKFELDEREDLAHFREELKKLIQLGENQKEAKKKIKKSMRFPYDIKSGGRKALERTLELVEAIQLKKVDREAALKEIVAMMRAFQLNLTSPYRKEKQLLIDLPVAFAKRLRHQKIKPAGTSDSRRDPAPSSYWQPLKNTGQNLYTGFDRASVPDFETPICSYVKAKTGWGAHPGFTVNCGGKEDVKFKLGDEIYGGPFNTRLFWIMGYNVTPIDHVEELKVAYDRRILSEFHSRQLLKFDVKLIFVKLKSFVSTLFDDPFNYIRYAVLKDGTKVYSSELKKRLFKKIPPGDPKDPDYPRPETMPNNYNEEFESQIAYLAFVPGAMAADPDDVKEIGPWRYDEFDVEERREVRAVQILSAWVGNYVMRWENTSLCFVKMGKKDWQLRHFFSDVGTGFGATKNFWKQSNSDVNAMEWRVSERRSYGVKLSGFQQNTPNPAFDELTLEDAQWMVRKIAGLSEQQIWDALSATGMKGQEQVVAFEKLLSRRAHMVRDFGLGWEFPEIVNRRFDESLVYGPGEAGK